MDKKIKMSFAKLHTHDKKTGNKRESIMSWLDKGDPYKNKDFKITATGYVRSVMPFADKTQPAFPRHGKGAHLCKKMCKPQTDICIDARQQMLKSRRVRRTGL